MIDEPHRLNGTPVPGPIVLVVEDQPLLRMLLADTLTDAGYRVVEAGNGLDALGLLERCDTIQAIVTDIEMPKMDGLALSRAVSERWPHIAVLITSGRVRPDDDELPQGADFIPKPYDPDRLVMHFAGLLT